MSELTTEKMKELLNQMRSDLIAEFTQIVDSKLASLAAKVFELEQENDLLKANLLNVKRHAIANEQYTRRENVRIMGLPAETGEICHYLIPKYTPSSGKRWD